MFFVALFAGYFWVRNFLFLRLRTLFADGVPVVMMQARFGLFLGLETSH